MKYKVLSDTYTHLVKNVREYFLEVETNIWDRRNKIKILLFQKEEITIKSFKIPHIVNKVAYTFFRDSKAKKSYENSLKIMDFVPKPIGYTEFFKFGLLDESYFLCEKFNYDFTIREVLIDNHYDDKMNIFQTFADFTYDLHENGIEHLDYSPGNILIRKLDNTYEFKIIDVNRMKFKTFTMQERLENFSKLWASNEDLKIIVAAYAKKIDIEEEKAIDIALTASQKHKDKKNLKKRLKGKKVVD
ncbi:MAG: lipopolysaccharide kinase InaA family protein [Campylobacterota bacterium]|nr:lipopolysaccharide kinase InaA family protein [Campylobacterota bacterium]